VHPSSVINRDWKDQPSAAHPRRPRVNWHLTILAIGLSAFAVLATIPDDAEAKRSGTEEMAALQSGELRERLVLPAIEAAPAPPAPPAPAAPVTRQWHPVQVKSGDSLSLIFDRVKLNAQQLHAVMTSGGAVKALKELRPGQEIAFDIQDGELQALRLDFSALRSLLVKRQGDSFESLIEERPVELRLAHAGGTIDNSLFQAGKNAGLSDAVIMALADIFGWDVDFALDIRQGDSFSLLYEERFLDGEKIGDGDVVAAEFVNQGRVHRAIRFVDPSGYATYYNPEGLSMRKAFLRSPVDFRRISSGFQPERYHPVLGVKRPHRGVDYAAATGTPIKAAGDGKIAFQGWKGGYGRTVVIQHGATYSTLYAHMSKFRNGLKSGSRVRQGETIGYVGKSGLATGPHLHYEFLVSGAHRNPLTVKLPSAAPIAKEHRPAFDALAHNLVAQLDVLKRTQIALEP
jgi:murein DD-endopeptidase MepM/ murein hydrolase activator NlpD